MAESTSQAVSVTVTCQELISLAKCSYRMTGYADPDGSRLISIAENQNNMPVRLILDRHCIGCNCTNDPNHCKAKEKFSKITKKGVVPCSGKK